MRLLKAWSLEQKVRGYKKYITFYPQKEMPGKNGSIMS